MAKQRVMHTFAAIGLSDLVPDTMRVMYALKVQQATSYIAAIDAGDTSYRSLNSCIEDEAKA
ncbi:hypothetical protein PSX44_23565, partial [Shigella flexneri]|nr:hypothetical protein [Shigella flexneri]